MLSQVDMTSSCIDIIVLVVFLENNGQEGILLQAFCQSRYVRLDTCKVRFIRVGWEVIDASNDDIVVELAKVPDDRPSLRWCCWWLVISDQASGSWKKGPLLGVRTGFHVNASMLSVTTMAT